MDSCTYYKSQNLSSTNLQGATLGIIRRSKRRKKWTDNVIGWTERLFTETQTLARNRNMWKELVRFSAEPRPYDQIWSCDMMIMNYTSKWYNYRHIIIVGLRCNLTFLQSKIFAQPCDNTKINQHGICG